MLYAFDFIFTPLNFSLARLNTECIKIFRDNEQFHSYVLTSSQRIASFQKNSLARVLNGEIPLSGNTRNSRDSSNSSSTFFRRGRKKVEPEKGEKERRGRDGRYTSSSSFLSGRTEEKGGDKRSLSVNFANECIECIRCIKSQPQRMHCKAWRAESALVWSFLLLSETNAVFEGNGF